MTEADKESLIDWEVGLAATGGKPSVLCELIEIFFAEYPKELAEIRRAIDERSSQDVRLFAHTLKGCLRYFGESRAVTVAIELEAAGVQEMFDRASDLLPELHSEIALLIPELEEYIDLHR